MEAGLQPNRSILAIFRGARDGNGAFVPTDFVGTGFLISADLLMTCRHVVSSEGTYIAASRNPGGGYGYHTLTEITPSPDGHDLAIAKIDPPAPPPFSLSLAPMAPAIGEDVWTYGYPFTINLGTETEAPRFQLAGRYMQSYITRIIHLSHMGHENIPTIEIGMAAPQGLSGAPIVRFQSREVVGVVYGNASVATIEEVSSVDPQTGVRTPEVQRVMSFGLCHDIESLWNFRSPLTGGQDLRAFLSRR